MTPLDVLWRYRHTAAWWFYVGYCTVVFETVRHLR